METKEITMLRQDVADLRARLDDLAKAQRNDREETIKAIKDVYTTAYGHIAKIYDYLWPVVRKVFPNWQAAEDQIAAFMKGHLPLDGEENRPKPPEA